MLAKFIVLFCDNEHGTGDVMFPDFGVMDAHGVAQEIIKSHTAASLRRAAKEQGWGRVNGGDYCPGCMESM